MPGRLRENGKIKTKIHVSRILQILNSESDYSQSQGERLRLSPVSSLIHKSSDDRHGSARRSVKPRPLQLKKATSIFKTTKALREKELRILHGTNTGQTKKIGPTWGQDCRG
jgi:hypothetical protein